MTFHSASGDQTNRSTPPEGVGVHLYERLLERMQTGLVLFQGDLFEKPEILHGNECFARITGHDFRKLAEAGFSLLAGKTTDMQVVSYLQKSLAENKPVRTELRLTRQSGTSFWAAVELFREEGGVGVLRLEDISARKTVEEQLGNDQERLSVTLKAIGEGVIIAGARGETDFMNREAERLTGHAFAKSRGKPFADIFRIIGEKNNEPRSCPIRKVFKTGQILGPFNDVLLVSADGSQRKVSYHASPIIDVRGRVAGGVIVFRDISTQSMLEREMHKIQKMESMALLSEGIAHDFNNILTGILGNLSLARSSCEPGGRITNILEAAEKAAARAKDLTHQLMTFSRGKASSKQQVSLKDLLRECTGFILSGSNCRCQAAIARDLWPGEVDEGQISQVINNLLINATQAMPEGGTITVKAENVELGAEPSVPLEPGYYVRLRVEDDGPGIQPENLSRVFDPYFTTKRDGNGLGLATSYSIIKSHGGHIMVDSEIGKGTRFTFYLPALPDAGGVGQQTEGKLYHGKGRILVMDDEPMIQQITGDMLTHLGYEVHFAKDGDEAVENYRTAAQEGNPFDLVMFDLTVPGGMGGHESLQRIAQEFPDVRGIVSSGYSSNPIMNDYRKFGFIGALSKPYTIQQLSWVLNDVLSQKEV